MRGGLRRDDVIEQKSSRVYNWSTHMRHVDTTHVRHCMRRRRGEEPGREGARGGMEGETGGQADGRMDEWMEGGWLNGSSERGIEGWREWR